METGTIYRKKSAFSVPQMALGHSFSVDSKGRLQNGFYWLQLKPPFFPEGWYTPDGKGDSANQVQIPDLDRFIKKYRSTVELLSTFFFRESSPSTRRIGETPMLCRLFKGADWITLLDESFLSVFQSVYDSNPWLRTLKFCQGTKSGPVTVRQHGELIGMVAGVFPIGTDVSQELKQIGLELDVPF